MTSSHVSSNASLLSADGSRASGPLSAVLAQAEELQREQQRAEVASPTEMLAITAITDQAFQPQAAYLEQMTHGITANAAPLSSYPVASSLPLTASFDPFPGLSAHQRHRMQGSTVALEGSTSTSYQPTAAALDYSLNAAGEPETPSDILHYYQSYSSARSQVVCQALAAVSLVHRSWSLLCLLAKDAQAKARIIKPKEVVAGARQSTLAASYMSMVQAQQEQQQQAALALEIQMEEDEEALAAEEADVVIPRAATPLSISVNSVPLAGSSSPTLESDHSASSIHVHIEGLPLPRAAAQLDRRSSHGSIASSSGSRALGAAEIEKAVAIAHQVKIIRESEAAERVKAEEEEKRYQHQITQQQQKLEKELQPSRGESLYMHLQEESKSIPHGPLRVGIIGCGAMGSRIAEGILEQWCGVGKDGKMIRTPPQQAGVAGVRLFISTRRPDHPAVVDLVKRAGGSSGPSGTHGQGGLLTVYFDNARLLTECNVVLICTLPHQVEIISSTLRSLSPQCRPRSQVFFSITASHTMKALRHLLGKDACVAKTELVLPHLLLKDSPASATSFTTFTSSLLSCLTQSLTRHVSFFSSVGPEAVERVVEGGKKELEGRVGWCFEAGAPRPSSMVGVYSQTSVTMTAASIISRRGTANAHASQTPPTGSKGAPRALPAGTAFSPSSSTATRSSLHHPLSPSSPLRSSSLQNMSPASSAFQTTAGGVATTLPKLAEIRMRQQQQQEGGQEEKESRPTRASSNMQQQPSANGGQSAGWPQRTQPTAKFEASERAKLFQAQF